MGYYPNEGYRPRLKIMSQTKEQLLQELGFSLELIKKMQEGEHLLNLTFKEEPNFNCVTVETEDFTELIISEIDSPFTNELIYSV